MSVDHIADEGLLVLPRLRIQNANAISSPLTHGFPSITAFAGFMWALERRLTAAGINLGFDAFGVICHSHQEQVADGYVKTFHLTRNPVDRAGDTAAIIEEGRVHLELTLIFSAFGKGGEESHIFRQSMQEARDKLTKSIAQQICTMRVAGGSIVLPEPEVQLIPISESTRTSDFQRWRRRWLPGFALVSRDDLLKTHWEKLKSVKSDTSLLDAWLDLSRFNYKAEQSASGKVKWQHDRPQHSGWIVPIPIGYGSLSELYGPSEVHNARDTETPFRFVESLHSIGQWLGPHQLSDIDQLLWKPDNAPERGLYRLRNSYRPSP
ncbi:hypothetical protein AXK11_00765 [Cephaloticoccus primus]|uniref:Type I-F CRISPR-associated protein Csy2 n=1 Tax=Cephaloticoccus primus TaxID=1548207 RepID=A0A139SI35_9BACT|nr:type I-F CRISPR-associated protein Csy2 [Cephaloticoccus primus]KXU34209.1 hypothetical protein AXK11_00765 [Cephaloticoccus primus]